MITALLFAAAVTTHCQTKDVPLWFDTEGARLLVACDASFPQNSLWNLDRSDQLRGDLDGRFRTPAIDGKGSVVYVVDSGVLAAHEEFMTPAGSKVIAGIDVLRELGNAGKLRCDVPNWALEPCADSVHGARIDGHGTAVASVVAGNRVGVAPGASIVAVRAFGVHTGLTPEILLRALDAIVAHAAEPTTRPFRTAVIVMSIGLNEHLMPPEVEAKIRQMVSGIDGKRFLFTFFAGNADFNHCDAAGNSIVAPTRLGPSIEGAITVGGMSAPNDFWSNSCRGEVLGPAADVVVAHNTARDHYRPVAYSSGTSYGAPYVAGIAARMLQVNPQLTPAEIEDLLTTSPSRATNGQAVAVFVEPSSARHRAVGGR
jgi:subtilisin family serine protease